MVGTATGITGWLARAQANGDGAAATHAEVANSIEVGSSLETALAAILAGNAPGAIITDNGRYAGVLGAAEIVAVARTRPT